MLAAIRRALSMLSTTSGREGRLCWSGAAAYRCFRGRRNNPGGAAAAGVVGFVARLKAALLYLNGILLPASKCAARHS
jgi:hypothetical protein